MQEGTPMLVLTRRAGESVMIGDNVIITVLEARGEVIRLGIQAPRDVQVHREEVFRELQAANREAASPTTISLVNPGPVDTPLWDHLESQTGLLPPVPPEEEENGEKRAKTTTEQVKKQQVDEQETNQ